MPIIVKDFNWNQNETTVSINLPRKSVKISDIDILNSPEYLKVSYSPYFFECWLYDRVDDNKCEAKISNELISIEFIKLEPKIWPQLCHVEHENKDLMRQIRENALNVARENAEKIKKQKIDTIAENKKIALKEQMKLEEQDRTRITNIKESVKKQATEEIEEFKRSQKQLTSNLPLKALENSPAASAIVENSNKTVNSSNISSSKNNSSVSEKSKFIFEASDVVIPTKTKSNTKTKIEPDPRSSSKIQVKFTPRVFPTPSRESQEQNENDWLERQKEARKLNELPDELKDYSEKEINVDWLKDKANSFYKTGNYQAAVSVYNHAIRLYPKLPAFYSNRAACHFQLRNLMKCIEDCSKALELLTPPVESNLQSRIKAHVRRGSAFCELELYAEGLMDYEAALKLDSNNTELKVDADNIRRIIQGN